MAFDVPGLGPNAEDALKQLIKESPDTAVLSEDLESAGGNLTISAGTTIAAALQAIMDLADPSGG